MKIVLSSIEILDNWKTFLIHFFLLPLLSTALFVLLNMTITRQYNEAVVVASILLSGSLTASNQMSASFVNDTIRGIDRELARKNPSSFYYWGSKLLVIFLFSLALVTSNLIILKMFGLSMVLAIQNVMISPILIVYGMIIGATTAVLGWGRPNPYVFSNFIADATFILAGNIAPYQEFPPFFKTLSYVLPYARTMNTLYDGNISSALIIDVGIAIAWLIVGMIVYQYKIKNIGKYQRRTMI